MLKRPEWLHTSPAKPNFDRRPRTATTIYPELPPDQASISTAVNTDRIQT